MAKAKKRIAARKESSKRRKASAKSARKKTATRATPASRKKAQRSGEPTGEKFNEDLIRTGLQELAEFYEHDYGPSAMPELRPGAGFAGDREIERLGRLIGVVLKKPVAKAVKIDPAVSSTGSRYGYEFVLQELEAPEFARSDHGQIYAALLEQTKFMMDEGVAPEIAGQIIEKIYALSPDKRAAELAKELAYEGRTFRAILRAVRFVICNTSVRNALAVVVAAQAGTPAAAVAAANFLVVHMPWVALCPPALVAAVVGLITVMGVEGFCAWSGPYLQKFSKTVDQTGAGDNC